jgi:hypothetical protein
MGLHQDDEDGEGKVKEKGEGVGALAKVRHASASVSQISWGCARCFFASLVLNSGHGWFSGLCLKTTCDELTVLGVLGLETRVMGQKMRGVIIKLASTK